MMLPLEKLKYFRSRPSCAWQSAQVARMREAFGRLLETSGAAFQSSLPAAMEEESGWGEDQEPGESSKKTEESRSGVPVAESKLRVRTRYPLERPSE